MLGLRLELALSIQLRLLLLARGSDTLRESLVFARRSIVGTALLHLAAS